jgi:hypothetical protein
VASVPWQLESSVKRLARDKRRSLAAAGDVRRGYSADAVRSAAQAAATKNAAVKEAAASPKTPQQETSDKESTQ